MHESLSDDGISVQSLSMEKGTHQWQSNAALGAEDVPCGLRKFQV